MNIVVLMLTALLLLVEAVGHRESRNCPMGWALRSACRSKMRCNG